MGHLVSLDRFQCWPLAHRKQTNWAAGRRVVAVADWLKLLLDLGSCTPAIGRQPAGLWIQVGFGLQTAGGFATAASVGLGSVGVVHLQFDFGAEIARPVGFVAAVGAVRIAGSLDGAGRAQREEERPVG